jgi:hypothetical protein
MSLLVDHNTWRHYYRSRDTLPLFYYDMHPAERDRWRRGKVWSLGYSNSTGPCTIHSSVIEDTSVLAIRSADYSRGPWDGIRVPIR